MPELRTAEKQWPDPYVTEALAAVRVTARP